MRSHFLPAIVFYGCSSSFKRSIEELRAYTLELMMAVAAVQKMPVQAERTIRQKAAVGTVIVMTNFMIVHYLQKKTRQMKEVNITLP